MKRNYTHKIRGICYFLDKDGVNELINKSRKTVKKQVLEWIENEIYNSLTAGKKRTIVRVYKKYSKKSESGAFKYEKARSQAIKEVLDGYLTKDKNYNDTYENVDENEN